MEIQISGLQDVVRTGIFVALFLGGGILTAMGMFHIADAKRMEASVSILPAGIRKIIAVELIISAIFTIIMGFLLITQLMRLNLD